MKVKKICLTYLVLLSSFVSAGELVFSQYGFSINSLEAQMGSKSVETEVTQAVIMYLPLKRGFTGNVNVQIQPYAGSLAQYLELSESQFKQFDLTILRSGVEKKRVFFEYQGLLSGQELHWYSVAEKKGDLIYLVTATDLQANWLESKEKLISVANSFALQ